MPRRISPQRPHHKADRYGHEQRDGSPRPTKDCLGSLLRFNDSGPCAIRPPVDWSYKSISTASKSFNIYRHFCRFAESVSQSLDGGVEAMIEINKGVRRPEPIPQLFTCNHRAWMFHKQAQDLEWLFLEFYLDSALPQFTCTNVNLEDSESNNTRELGSYRHDISLRRSLYR